MIRETKRLYARIERAKKNLENFQNKCPHPKTEVTKVIGIPGGINYWNQCKRCDKLVSYATDVPTSMSIGPANDNYHWTQIII